MTKKEKADAVNHTRLLRMATAFMDEYQSELCHLSIREAVRFNPPLGKAAAKLYSAIYRSEEGRK